MKAIAFFTFWLLTYSRLFGESSVWKISDGNHTILIGGTIHLLRPSDYPLPVEFDRAFAKADYVVFETDISVINSNAFAAVMMHKMLLPHGQRLSQCLAPATYQALKAYLDHEGLPETMFEHLKPWGVMLTLTQLQLNKYGIDQNGADTHYAHKAAEEGKIQSFLETPEEQVDIITGIGEGDEDGMILQTLEEMKMLPSMMDWLVNDWQAGKTKRIQAELVETMEHDSPYMYRRILKQRNDIWLPKLISMMHQDKKAFVLVGAMHLVGKDGLLQRMRNQGYTVEYFAE